MRLVLSPLKVFAAPANCMVYSKPKLGVGVTAVVWKLPSGNIMPLVLETVLDISMLPTKSSVLRATAVPMPR